MDLNSTHMSIEGDGAASVDMSGAIPDDLPTNATPPWRPRFCQRTRQSHPGSFGSSEDVGDFEASPSVGGRETVRKLVFSSPAEQVESPSNAYSQPANCKLVFEPGVAGGCLRDVFETSPQLDRMRMPPPPVPRAMAQAQTEADPFFDDYVNEDAYETPDRGLSVRPVSPRPTNRQSSPTQKQASGSFPSPSAVAPSTDHKYPPVVDQATGTYRTRQQLDQFRHRADPDFVDDDYWGDGYYFADMVLPLEPAVDRFDSELTKNLDHSTTWHGMNAEAEKLPVPDLHTVRKHSRTQAMNAIFDMSIENAKNQADEEYQRLHFLARASKPHATQEAVHILIDKKVRLLNSRAGFRGNQQEPARSEGKAWLEPWGIEDPSFGAGNIWDENFKRFSACARFAGRREGARPDLNDPQAVLAYANQAQTDCMSTDRAEAQASRNPWVRHRDIAGPQMPQSIQLPCMSPAAVPPENDTGSLRQVIGRTMQRDRAMPGQGMDAAHLAHPFGGTPVWGEASSGRTPRAVSAPSGPRPSPAEFQRLNATRLRMLRHTPRLMTTTSDIEHQQLATPMSGVDPLGDWPSMQANLQRPRIVANAFGFDPVAHISHSRVDGDIESFSLGLNSPRGLNPDQGSGSQTLGHMGGFNFHLSNPLRLPYGIGVGAQMHREMNNPFGVTSGAGSGAHAQPHCPRMMDGGTKRLQPPFNMASTDRTLESFKADLLEQARESSSRGRGSRSELERLMRDHGHR